MYLLSLILGTLAITHGFWTEGPSPRERLTDDVIKHAVAGVLPVREQDPALDLEVGVALADYSIDLQTGEAYIYIWETFRWHDYHLYWDPKDYGDLNKVSVPEALLWTPTDDWTLFNSLESSKIDTTVVKNANVYSNGTVEVYANMKSKIHCTESEESRAGHKVWNCKLWYGSGTYHAYLMRPRFYQGMPRIDTRFLFKNVVGLSLTTPDATILTQKYDCCTEPFTSITYNFVISYKDKFSFW